MLVCREFDGEGECGGDGFIKFIRSVGLLVDGGGLLGDLMRYKGE